ncbi:hypothetical protein BC827DRAFT_743419 [Russula dissimulans]|nr:hypothetical protein BC827DRAFT_743419 [Russula dissimulans]
MPPFLPSPTTVVHEAGIDPNFALAVVRNDEELAAVSNCFVATFTEIQVRRKHPRGKHTSHSTTRIPPRSPGSRRSLTARRQTRPILFQKVHCPLARHQGVHRRGRTRGGRLPHQGVACAHRVGRGSAEVGRGRVGAGEAVRGPSRRRSRGSGTCAPNAVAG